MEHQKLQLRTPEQIFDDMLADDYSLEEIAHRLGWPNWRTRSHYQDVCLVMGEQPDV